jgi:hypothetical protein
MKHLLHACISAMVLACGVHAQADIPPAGAVKAAQDNFISYLTSAVPENSKTILGFKARDTLSHAVLGAPFRIYDLPDDSIKNYDKARQLRSIIAETDLWYFPIIIKDSTRMMLYVVRQDSTWKRVGLGSAGLSRHIQEISSRWPASAGYTPVIVQQRHIGAYMYSIPQINAYNLTETSTLAAKASHGTNGDTLQTLDNTINNLKNRISR